MLFQTVAIGFIMTFSLPFNRINKIHIDSIKKYTKEAEYIFNNNNLSIDEKSKLFDEISELYNIENILNNRVVNQIDTTDYFFWSDYYDKYNTPRNKENTIVGKSNNTNELSTDEF